MEGTGRDTYDRIRLYLQTNRDNFAALGLSEALSKLDSYLASERPWANNATKTAREIYDEASAKISERAKEARETAQEAVERAAADLKENTSLAKLDGEAQEELLRPFTDELPKRVSDTKSIDGLENIVHSVVPKREQRCREEIEQRARPEVKIRYAKPGEKRVSFGKSELASIEDVDEYAEALRAQYRTLIEEGKRISL